MHCNFHFAGSQASCGVSATTSQHLKKNGSFGEDADSALAQSDPLCQCAFGVFEVTLIKGAKKMRFGKVSLAALAAASLISAPVVAQSTTASKAPVKRTAVAKKEESKLGGGSGVIVAVVAAAAIIAGIVIAAGNDDDAPTSP
jgi:hypothetical protein